MLQDLFSKNVQLDQQIPCGVVVRISCCIQEGCGFNSRSRCFFPREFFFLNSAALRFSSASRLFLSANFAAISFIVLSLNRRATGSFSKSNMGPLFLGFVFVLPRVIAGDEIDDVDFEEVVDEEASFATSLDS